MDGGDDGDGGNGGDGGDDGVAGPVTRSSSEISHNLNVRHMIFIYGKL